MSLSTNPGVRNPWPGNLEVGSLQIDNPASLLGPGISTVGSSPNQKLASSYNGVDAVFFAADPNNPTEACVAAAFSSNISPVVVVRRPITINNPINIPAASTLVFMPGTYTVGNNGNIQMGVLSSLICPGGAEQTILQIPASYTRTDGVIITTNGGIGTGATIEGLQINFFQPSTATRASMIHYPPAIVVGQRARILHCKINQAWVGVDGTQSPYCGGLLVDDLQISSFNVGIQIDNCLDTVRLNNLHAWPFGFTTDTLKMTAFEDPTNIGVSCGRCDGLEINDGLFFIGLGLFSFVGTGAFPGQPIILISNTDFDSFNGIAMSGGLITVTSSCLTLINGYTSLNIVGGSISFSGVKWISAGGDYFINQGGGDVQISGGQVFLSPMTHSPFTVQSGTADFRASDLKIDSLAIDQTVFSNLGGYMSITNSRFNYTPNIVFAQPKVSFTTTGSRGIISDNVCSDIGTGSQVFLNVPVNTFVFAHHNMLLGATINPASSSGLIHIDNNF